MTVARFLQCRFRSRRRAVARCRSWQCCAVNEPPARIELTQAIRLADGGQRRGELFSRPVEPLRRATAWPDRAVRAPVDRNYELWPDHLGGLRRPHRVEMSGPQRRTPTGDRQQGDIDPWQPGHAIEEVGVTGEVHRSARRRQHVADGGGIDPAVRPASCRVDGRNGLHGHAAERRAIADTGLGDVREPVPPEQPPCTLGNDESHGTQQAQ